MSKPACFDRFESLGFVGAQEVALSVAGAAKEGLAVGAFAVILRSGRESSSFAATSIVGSEEDATPAIGSYPPPPASALAAEWYALTFALNHLCPENRFVVSSASRPIIDFLRGQQPFSRLPWLGPRQREIAARYASKILRVEGRLYARLQTRREAERKTRRIVRVTTSDLAVLVPLLASHIQIEPVMDLARSRVESEIRSRV